MTRQRVVRQQKKSKPKGAEPKQERKRCKFCKTHFPGNRVEEHEKVCPERR